MSRFRRAEDYRRVGAIRVNFCHFFLFGCFPEASVRHEYARGPNARALIAHHGDDHKKRRVTWQDQNQSG
jgi:hypothetical protein